MSCNSCGSAGTCGCSSIEIPVGPPGPAGPSGSIISVVVEAAGVHCVNGGIKVTDSDGNLYYVCNGNAGTNATSGTTTNKYANTFVVTSYGTGASSRFDGPTISPIVITKAAIIACSPLISTCISTPADYDFVLNIWKQNGSQWDNVTYDPSFITSITYDTAGSVLTILTAVTGTYRVVILG